MYTNIDQWMHDPDFSHHISVASQLGKTALPQAIEKFKSEFSDVVSGWKEGGSLLIGHPKEWGLTCYNVSGDYTTTRLVGCRHSPKG